MVWELVFMMVVLKLPILYLCGVVWWAIRAEPRPLEPAPILAPVAPVDPEPRPWPDRRRRPRARGPHGGPARAHVRRAPAPVRAEARR